MQCGRIVNDTQINTANHLCGGGRGSFRFTLRTTSEWFFHFEHERSKHEIAANRNVIGHWCHTYVAMAPKCGQSVQRATRTIYLLRLLFLLGLTLNGWFLFWHNFSAHGILIAWRNNFIPGESLVTIFGGGLNRRFRYKAFFCCRGTIAFVSGFGWGFVAGHGCCIRFNWIAATRMTVMMMSGDIANENRIRKTASSKWAMEIMQCLVLPLCFFWASRRFLVALFQCDRCG